MASTPRPEMDSDSSVLGAAGRAIEAGHRIVVNRIDLARLDILRAFSDALRGSTFVVAGGLLAAIGWLALSVAATLAIQPYILSWSVSVGIVGAVNLVAGGVLATTGIRRARPEVGSERGREE